MSMTRRFLAGLGLPAPAVARGQGFAARPVRLIVPFAAGGPTDRARRASCPRPARRMPARDLAQEVAEWARVAAAAGIRVE